MALTAPALLLLYAGIAWYDTVRGRIPNRASLPLLAGAFLMNFPGDPQRWLGCAVLLFGWRQGMLGAGDAKLWMALLWLTPQNASAAPVGVMGASFAVTGLVQLAVRRVRGVPATGVRGPGAWRTLPYAFWLAVGA